MIHSHYTHKKLHQLTMGNTDHVLHEQLVIFYIFLFFPPSIHFLPQQSPIQKGYASLSRRLLRLFLLHHLQSTTQLREGLTSH